MTIFDEAIPMFATVAGILKPVLEFPFIRRIRRNHALEHATAHMLARRVPNLKVSGRASEHGFSLICDVPQEKIEESVQEAIRRMKQGEAKWAIHPNCGTNLVATSFLTTLAGIVGLSGDKQSTGDKFSRTMILMIFALLFSPAFGSKLQQHFTTKADLGDLDYLKTTRQEMSMLGKKIVMYTIHTQKG
jgi:hypothetical protein